MKQFSLCPLKLMKIRQIAGFIRSAPVLTLAASALATAPGMIQAQDSASSSSATPALEEVLVTGTLIKRADGYVTSSPISSVSSDQIDSVGQPSLDVAIGQLPQFAAAQGQAEVGDAQVNVGFNGGQSNSDLRGLGANRSLVLLDGRRLMPSSPDGSVDLNTIPKALLENVEIVTGGGSATYGSDAIAGVVNFRLKRDFSGFQIDYQYGATTDEGDDDVKDLSVLMGSDFAEGKGHGVLAFEYATRDTVLGSARPFFSSIRQLGRPPEGIISAGSFAGGAPTIGAVNQVLAADNGGMIAGNESDPFPGSVGFNTDGSLFTQNAGPNCVQNFKGLGPKGINISDDCTRAQVALGQFFAVQVPLDKYNAFATADYELNDHVTVFGQFNFSETEAISASGSGSTKPSIPLNLPLDSPFVTGNDGLQTLLESSETEPSGPLVITKLMSAFGERTVGFDTTTWQASGGARGNIPNTSFNWEIYGSKGRSNYVNTFTGDVSLSAVNSILDGTVDFQGNEGDCVGFAWNPLGNNPVSAGCEEFAGRSLTNVNTLEQREVQATLEGPLVTLPAGEARFALGYGYRNFEFEFSPDDQFVAQDSLAFGTITPAEGDQKVNEVFAELFIPVLDDKPFVEELSLELGFRNSAYEDIGGAEATFKANVNWKATDWLRLRAGRSRAIRAPSPFDLSGPTARAEQDVGTPPAAGDPCDVRNVNRTGANGDQVEQLCQDQGIPANLLPNFTLTSSSTQAQTGSNPDLKPETAKIWTGGVVLEPALADNLGLVQLTLDYYSIEIDQAVGLLSNTDVLERCFNADGSNPNFSVDNAFCQRIDRNPSTGGISLIRSGRFNFQTIETDGIDLSFRYSLPLSFGRDSSVQFSSLFTYLNSFEIAGLFGSESLDFAGSSGFGTNSGAQFGGNISHPEWKGNTSLTFNYGPVSATGRWRFIGEMDNSDRVLNPDSLTPGVDSFSYFDFNTNVTINDRVSIGFSVTNIGDKKPPRIAGTPLTTDAALFDVIGRGFNLSSQLKF